jgi:hypothetical protein
MNLRSSLSVTANSTSKLCCPQQYRLQATVPGHVGPLTQKSYLLNSPANTRIGTQLLKCVEGQYNKAFVLTLDNGSEVVAKLPNPNAGPAFYTTASEVATRQFVRCSHLGV